MSTIPKDLLEIATDSWLTLPYMVRDMMKQSNWVAGFCEGYKSQLATDGREELEKENAELKGWKESAISVMPDIQAIGKEMGLQIGQAISPKIIPYIKELKKDRDWFMEAHNYLLKEAAEYSTKSEKTIIDLESAFAGAEEMIKDKIKKISELEKAICLLTEVVDEQQQRLNNYDL